MSRRRMRLTEHGQVILIPLFRLFNAAGLIDTLWPLILIHTAMGIPICTLLMLSLIHI